MDSDRSPDPRDHKEERRNCYKCRLTCLAPTGKSRALAKTVTKLTNWFDPYQQIVNVEDNIYPERDKKGPKLKVPRSKGCLVTPALSVMMYIRETGEMCVKDAENILKKTPWKFHHKVELQNKSYPNTSLAKQEFYKLAPDLPLFAACPVLTENEHLRISLYVHDFNAMVEFYRLITDTEIETNKPEFCIFQIYQQPGLDVQLSLKRSKYIFPVPVESAYVSFNVRNIDTVKLGLKTDVKHVNGNVYTTRDPDGNLVVLYETSCDVTDASSHLASSTECLLESNLSVDDLKSLKSTSESHDSGRYSDVEGTLTDGIIPEENPRKTRARERTVASEASEGYGSSMSLGGEMTGPGKDVNKGKTLKHGMTVIKRSGMFTETTDNTLMDADVSKENVAPVYI